MTNLELEKANQALMEDRARIKREQQELTKVLDERLTHGFDLKVTRRIRGGRRTKRVWLNKNEGEQYAVQPEGFEVEK